MNDVTVIIPCGGRHSLYVAEAVNSAINAGACKVIVVDDKAQPKVSISESDSVVVIRTDHHIDRCAARNMAVKMATTTWLYFLDADDWMELTALDDFGAILTGNPNLDLIYADYHYRPQDDPQSLIPVKKAPFVRNMNHIRNLVNIGMFVRTDRFKLVGGFNEDIVMAEYWDFFLRYTANTKVSVYKHTRPFFIARMNGSVHPHPERALKHGSRRVIRLIKSGYYSRWGNI